MRAELEPDDPMVRALNHGSRVLIERFTPLFSGVISAFGVKLRDGLTLEQFTHTTVAFLEGLWFRPSPVRSYDISTSDDGWSLFARGVWAIVKDFLVDDPDHGPITDLSV